MSNPNPIIQEKTQFSSTNQPENRGRKKNRFKFLKNQYKLSSDDIENIISYLATLRPEILERICKKKKLPAIMIGFAKAVLNATKTGNISQLEMMITRLLGKPKEPIDINLPEKVKVIFEDAGKGNTEQDSTSD